MATIHTTRGEIDETLLTKREGVTSAGAWVEYYMDGVLVHRSMSVALRGASAFGAIGTCEREAWPAFGTVGTFERYGVLWSFGARPR